MNSGALRRFFGKSELLLIFNIFQRFKASVIKMLKRHDRQYHGLLKI